MIVKTFLSLAKDEEFAGKYSFLLLKGMKKVDALKSKV